MLELVVFACGAVVMVLEMVGSRILAPFLGTSIIVWTSLIGVILGSLSIGYWWGGVKADRDPSRGSLSLIILMAAFFIAGVAVAKSFVLGFLQDHAMNIRFASAIATVVLFAPPSVLLGMVTPYAVKLKLESLEKSGNTVGRLYAISTIGSILGTFLGGFYLIAFFGSTRILYVLCIVLVLTSLAASTGKMIAKVAALALFVLLMTAAGSYESYLAARGLHDIDTNYNRIVVYDAKSLGGGAIRIMTTHPKAMQSAMRVEEPDLLLLPYTRFFEMAFHFKPDISRLLVLGGGGYSFPKYVLKNYPNAAVDVVEIDPRVTELARKFFFLEDDPRLTVIHEDARSALHRMSGKYDAILVDVFNSHYSIPFHLTTRETAELLREKLADDGVVMLNILSGIEGREGRFLRAEYATYKSVFEQVRLYPVADSEDESRWQNVMLVALKSGNKVDFSGRDSRFAELLSHLREKPLSDDMSPLTDDFAPVEMMVSER
ncbi:MAG: fused MFS/spermidine synthase [Syntrophobacteraceae bacterium]